MATLTTQDAADKIGVTRRRVLALIKAGHLKATRIGRDWMLDDRDVAAFAKLDRPRGVHRTNGRPRNRTAR